MFSLLQDLFCAFFCRKDEYNFHTKEEYEHWARITAWKVGNKELEEFFLAHDGPMDFQAEFVWIDHSGHNDFDEARFTCAKCGAIKRIRIYS